ncbi:hypothetical protein A6R68_01764 [Neotoma lepida]|uniref:40S ribosomal protein SA C-terminal domain-containing protein n=1 Tax=Neotoma lepida TaxID=56216 RepID=A0A1A6GVP2_NEOLE|nr:hypothetical protein A6R68_01764 [Neotoma lepida]
MGQHIYKRKSHGICIINLNRTWEKLSLAAQAILAVKNSADVSVISSRNTGQRAGLKFGAATAATLITGLFTPGTFTNQRPEEIEKEEQAATEKAVIREEFQGMDHASS